MQSLIWTKSKIAIVGLHNKEYEFIGKYAHYNKKKYAEKHGYDVFLYHESLDLSRHPQWSKLFAVSNHLQNYDWIFWLDSDALIMNEHIKLEDIIDDNYDFITTRDSLNFINSGQWLLKNTEFSKKFLNNWYNIGVIIEDGVPQDNGALLRLLKHNKELRDKTKILPQRMLSSYINCPIWSKIDGEFSTGDFIVHFPGILLKDKEPLMKKFFNIIYPDVTI